VDIHGKLKIIYKLYIKMVNQNILYTSIIVVFIIIAIVIIKFKNPTIQENFLVAYNTNPPIITETCDGNDFYIHNYYLVPITVEVITKEGKIKTIARDILPIDKKGINKATVNEYIRCDSAIKIHAACGLIGESLLTIPEGKSIKALHIGQNMSSMDIAMTGDITKSALGGNAIPRLRIVNTTPRTITLTTNGNNRVVILPGTSFLYLGAHNNEGLSLGTTFKDVDGLLQPYVVNFPASDLFLGIISDLSLPLYNNTQRYAGNQYTDQPGTNFYGLQVDPLPPHKGSLFIDNLYIPRNW
jgi:hypothetical protein